MVQRLDPLAWYVAFSWSKTVKLPVSKNIYSEDIVISNDLAIFATSKSSIKHGGPHKRQWERLLLPDGETMSFAIRFIYKSKISAYLRKMVCKISIFLLKACKFHFHKNF